MRTERFDSDFDVEEPQPTFKRFVIYRDDSKWGDRTLDQIEALHYAYLELLQKQYPDAVVEDVWIADHAETEGGQQEFFWDESFGFDDLRRRAGVMRRDEAIEWVVDHCDQMINDEELVSAFTALYGRDPGPQDEQAGLWELCLAALVVRVENN